MKINVREKLCIDKKNSSVIMEVYSREKKLLKIPRISNKTTKQKANKNMYKS